MVSNSTGKTEVILRCPAKINLMLKVGKRRSDGFHEILTVFQTISLYDELTIETEASSFYFSSNSSLAWDSRNTLYRVLREFEEHYGRSIKIGLSLKKNIPVGGGLGGGSSDAAALLRYLGFAYGLSTETQFKIACRVGSDVPFLLRGGTAIGRGRGEKLSFPGDIEDYSVDLAFPGIEVSTSMAYGLIDTSSYHKTTEPINPEELIIALRRGDTAAIELLSVNDFETPVFDSFPQIATAYGELASRKAIVTRMTGSGSTLFALFSGNGGSYRFVTAKEMGFR